MQGSQQHSSHANLKSESVWFKTKLILQFLSLSFLLSNPFYLSYLHAAPVGGNIVGGSGSISQTELTTTINQSSQNLAVDWQSFDVNTNERVQFVQPNSSSIALNRIIGNNGSVIQGRIDANGQVILINPNGILFTSSATVNVGGLIASSLDMSPSDFMNGNYIFNEVLGADGAVVNSGIINASLGGDSITGGNVALIGKQVKNTGLITANLGSIVLAAGKKSILTFDNNGLIGVTVTKEVLQEELGLDAAVINSGEINASGGRVLLTASVSQDVFSQAVNNNSLDAATSVVVHEDGSFTLGGGADVLNTGSIDVSLNNTNEVNNKNTARIILLGENITSSGSIKADAINGNAGEIEVHAKNKTLLVENSITSAVALATGKGGLIKILGDKVGLFDESQVNASGANGGGEVLIGGDRQGLNSSIRNAEFIYLGENSTVKADATGSGNGGKIITFAKDTARIHGNLFARGGLNSGDGGFIETSGLRGFEISNAPDVSAFNGNGGLWLIDPYNITIVNDATTTPTSTNITETTSGGTDAFTSNGDSAVLEVGLIEQALLTSDVEIITGSPGILDPPTNETGDITFEADLVFDINGGGGGSTNKLTLNSSQDIIFTNTSSITSTTNDSLDLTLTAGRNVFITSDTTDISSALLNGINLQGGTLEINSGGLVSFNSGTVDTAGGKIDIKSSSAVSFNTGTILTGSADVDIESSGTVIFNAATITTSGGKVDIKSSSGVAFNGGTISTNGDDFKISTTGNVTSLNPSTNSITLSGGNFIVDDAIDFDSSNVNINVGSGDIDLDGSGTGVTGDVILGSLTASNVGGSDLTITKATSISQSTGSIISIARNTDLDVTSGTGTHAITLENNNNFNNIKLQGTDVSIVDMNGIDIIGGTNVSNSLKITAAGNITDDGDITATNTIFDTTINATTFGDVTLNNNNDFNTVKILNANDVVLKDTVGSIAIEANDGVNSGGIRGLLTVTTTDTTATSDGNITDMGGLPISGGGTYTGEINVGGAATFNIATGRSLTLDNDNNTFGGSVVFNTYNHNNPEIKDITFTDSTSLTLSDIAVTGNLTVKGERIKFAHLAVEGDLTATTTGTPTTTDTFAGSITQTSGEHIVSRSATGLATFNATGDITLEDSGNDFSYIAIGDAADTTFARDVSIVDEDWVVLNKSFTTGDLKIQSGGNIYLAGDISSNMVATINAGNIEFIGDVVLDPLTDGSTITVDSNAAGSLTDGTVTFRNNINNNNGNSVRNNLAINSGDGTVDIQGSVGNTDSIASLLINDGVASTATVNLHSVKIHGESGGGDSLDVTAGTIHLFSNIDTDDGSTGQAKGVNLNGNVILEADITIDTSDSSSDGAVTISGTVISDTANRRLYIVTDTGAVDLQQDIGGTTALTALERLYINRDVANAGGVVNLAGVRTEGGSDVLTVRGTTINLGGDLISNANGNGGNVLLTGNVVLNNDVVITSDVNGNGGSSGDVTITGNLNSDATPRSLNINVDNNNINIAGAGTEIGGSSALQKVDLLTDGSAGTQIDVNAITTTDANATTNNTGVVLTAATINLGGDITSNTISGAGTEGGIVDINGDAVLKNNISINTNLASSTLDGTVDFNNTVDADSATNNRSLTIDSGSAAVTFNDDIGSSEELYGLTINSASTTSLKNVDIQTGGIDITSTTINLGGGLDTTALDDAGIISLSGNVNLNTAGSNVVFNTVGNTSDASISITGSVNNTSSKNLTLNAGTADVSMTGTAGTGIALNSLTITGNNVDLGQVTSIGAIDVTGNSSIDLSGDLTTTGASGTIDLRQGDVSLLSNLQLTTNNNTVSIDGNLNSDASSPFRTFSVSVGNNDITVNGDIGTANALQKVDLLTDGSAGTKIDVNAITTTDANSTTNNTGVVLTAATINLGGDITSNTISGAGTEGGIVDINGAAILKSNVSINTNLASSTTLDGAVDFSSTIDADSAGNNRSLTIDSGSATVTFNDDIGSSEELYGLTINSASTTSLKNVDTQTGGIDITSTTINLGGGLDTTALNDAGIISLSGNVNLNTAGSNVVFNTVGNTSDASISITGSVNNTSSKNLTLTAGTADLSMTGTAGTGIALNSLTITGNNVDLGQVTSIGAIDVTGNSSIDLSGDLTTTGASGTIDLRQGDVTLRNNVTLQVANNTANNISVEGAINADLNTNNRSLTIVSGSGLINLQGDIGTSNAIQGLSITAAASSITKLQAVTTRNGGISVTTSSLNLAGDLNTNDTSTAGDISLTAEKIDLENSLTFNTNSTVDGKIDILSSGTSLGLDGGSNSLTVNAGLGNVTISHNITNVSSFYLQSSGTTTLNGITSLGTIISNASNGLTLNGNYSAITSSNEFMRFNADSDANGIGTLVFGDGSSFVNTSGPISFTGAALGSNNTYTIRTGTAGSHAVEFNATNNMSLGDSTVGFSLNNTKLSNITASSINLSATNDIYFSNVTQSSGPAYTLSANNITNTGNNTSLFSTFDAAATTNFNVGANIISTNNLSLTGTAINITNNSLLTSVNGDVILNGAITGSNSDLSIAATNGSAEFVSGSSINGLGSISVNANTINLNNTSINTINNIDLTVLSNGGTYNQNENIESQLGDIIINAGDNIIVMASGTTIKSNGDTNISTSNGSVALSSIESTTGTITINAGNGNITDNNGGATNITSTGSVSLTATGGIGSGDPLELTMDGLNAKLTAINYGSGNIEFVNVGNITLENIENNVSGGKFSLENTSGNVTIESLVIDKVSDQAIATFDVTGGDVLGVQGQSTPHVTANTAIFNMNNTGSVGRLGEPIITDVPNKIEVISATGTYIQFYGQVPPKDFIGDNAYRNRALQAIESLSGQQLIEVESLAEIDPAIFTDVRNYLFSYVSY